MLLLIVFNLLVSFLFLGSFGRFLGIQGAKFFSVFNIFFNIISIFILFSTFLNTTNMYTIVLGNWISSGFFNVEWSFIIDDLTITMLIVVNCISALVHLYSTEYMSKDPHLVRFMSYLTLFTFWMVMLITADNFLQLFLGWEGIGLCSYLLINFWFTRIQANKSALQAIIVNRISDFALTFGIFLVFYFFLSIDFSVPSIIQIFFYKKTILFCDFYILNIITFFLFFGAVGKSAQILLHTWLPSAMEGPTPVSALLHAATMVTAGIFLIIKCSALFEFSYTVLSILVFWGAITSIFAATSGLFLSDIKKVIAYSTCSQLGYMLLTCGFSNYNLSLFHLMNHAIFKAALFLCAGAIIHSLSNEQDMRRMGGLINFLPISYIVMFIASLAIIGFPFLTGFYSKDIIFEVVFNSFGSVNIFIYWIISITAFFTTVYSFRLLYFIFLNNNNSFRHYILNIHESSYAISISLLVLAFGSITSGFLFKDLFLGFGNFFLISNILPVIKNLNIFDSEFISTSVKLVPLLMGVLGICFCSFLILFAKKYLYYYTFFGNLVLNFLINKWYFDYIYNFYINLYIFDFAKRYIYKIIDKGMLEFFGPFGFWQILNYSNFKLLKTQNGFISYYLFYYSFFLFLFIYILKIDFFSFHILSFTFLGNVLNSSFFIKIKHFYLTQRFLFRCVKTQIIVEYLRTMNFFLEDPEINYWLLFEELLEDDDAFIQKVSRPLFNWELWSPITTYDMLWLKSFLHFGFIYWPKNTLVFLFGVLGILTFVVSYLYVFLYQNIIDFFWFFIIFFCRDLQQIFCLDHGGDLWFFFYIAVIGVFYFFSVTVYHFWNVGYAKLFILLRQNSVFSIMIQDFILLFFNFFFVIVLGILFLCIIGLCWDSVLDMAKDMEYNRLEYDPMYHIKRWRHFRYYFKRERTYKYWAHHSLILKYFCQNLEILSRPRIKIARDTVWKTANYMQTFILLDSYRNTESLLYTNDLITPYFNWVTWEALTPFRFIYTPVFSIVLWKDTFDIFFVLLLVICIGLKSENPYVLVDEYGRHILPEETLFYVRLTYSTVLVWYVSFMLFSEIFPYILYFINLALLSFWQYYLRKLELNLADFLQLSQTDRARLAHVDMLKNRIIIHLKVNFDLFIYPYWCIFISYFSAFQCKFSYYSNRAWAFIFGNNYFISSLLENLKFALSSKYGLVFLWLLNLTLIKIKYLCTFINNSYYKLYYFVWERFYNYILNNSEFFYFFGKYFLNLPFRIFLNFCKKSLKLYFKYFNKVKRT